MKRLFLTLFMIQFCFRFIMGQTVVSGYITGSNKIPLVRADVHLLRPINPHIIKSVKADNKGYYKIEIKSPGFYYLRFTGVDHQQYDVPVFAEKSQPIELNVQLMHNQYVDSIGSVKIIGGFNNFEQANAKEMTKQEDGIYTAEFKTDKDKFAYQLGGIEVNDRFINGTEAKNYTYDKDGDYRSIITAAKGTAKVVFNPKELVRDTTNASAVFGEKNTLEQKLFDRLTEMQTRQNRFLKEYNKRKGALPKIDWSIDAKSLLNTIHIETNPLLKKIAYIDYLQLLLYGQSQLDSETVVNAFKDIEPSSLVWGINPQALTLALGRTRYKIGRDYLTEVINENKDREVVAFALYLELSDAKYRGEKEKLREYYKKLVKDFADTEFGIAASKLKLEPEVVNGSEVPSFSVVSYDDSTKTFSNKSLEGKIYMIDFWASWCKGCKSEMEYLQKAYDKYKDEDFVILSLSFDKKPEDVKTFREGKWKMPWLHSFVVGGFKSKLAREFEVQKIPKPILVNKEGKIIASMGELRGSNLIKTLDKIFNGKEEKNN